MSARQAAAKHGSADQPDPGNTRGWVARVFTWIEDVVYIGLSVLLAASAVALLGHTANSFVRELLQGSLPVVIVALLDRLLLVLMIVELLYTVQVSFREHALVPEPFLIVGLVAAIRRVLVLTAGFHELQDKGDAAFRVAMIELGILTVMILALVASLRLLRRRGADAVLTKD
ncbi:MAG: phosphate-starvation-inducible PsiE family protein [Vicinamibacterales bacterium]